MFTRIFILLAALSTTTACVPVFDFNQPEKLTFDATPPSQAPVNVADLMCCYRCTV